MREKQCTTLKKNDLSDTDPGFCKGGEWKPTLCRVKCGDAKVSRAY